MQNTAPSISLVPQNTILFIIAFFCINSPSVASCHISNANYIPLSLNSSLMDIKLDIPSDTPDGTTVYEKAMGSLPDSESYICNGKNNMGLIANPAFSTQATNGKLFAMPGTGLSWYIKNDYVRLSSYYDYISTDNGVSAVLGASTYTFGLVKTGPIPTSTKPLHGLIATYKKDSMVLIKFNLDLTIIHQSASCKSPDVQVNMGTEHTLSSINTAPLPKVAFNINLFDCPEAINKIHYTLKANTPVIDSRNGVVALSSDSTARGLGLQLFNESSHPIELDKSQVFTDYTGNTGGVFQIPLKAAYYRMPSESLRPGTANSSVTFIMTYL
jgi:major type 1 subunit fimbrin (pilin)